MISFCFDTKPYKLERRTVFSNGLSDEEKKDTSDNFELHLESGLGNSRDIAVILIGFSSENGVNLKPTINQNCQDKYFAFALSCGFCGVAA